MEGVSYVEYRALCDSYTNMVVKYMQQGSLLYAAESEVRDLRSGEYLARVIEERDRYRKALEPFSAMAGELFARNWEDNGVVVMFDEECKLTFKEFRAARTALEATNEPT